MLMTRQQAKAIWSFVKRHQKGIGTIVCQCEQGISRSPAVAIALAQALGGDVRKIKSETHPNYYVYRRMRRATKADSTNREPIRKIRRTRCL